MAKDQKPKSEKAQTADDILASLIEDLKDVDKATSEETFENDLGLDQTLLRNIGASAPEDDVVLLDDSTSFSEQLSVEDNEDHSDVGNYEQNDDLKLEIFGINDSVPVEVPLVAPIEAPAAEATAVRTPLNDDDKTTAIPDIPTSQPTEKEFGSVVGDGEKTVAVAGYSQRATENLGGDKVKVSVGQMRGNALSSGYAAWGASDSHLGQFENLRIAQEKILDLEKENEKLRSQNEELIAASEIVKERADLLTSQIHEFKSDRDSLEQSFKNESGILKSQLVRKDAELVKAAVKIEELENRMKFDLKRIRVRERELENRLELIRAEKNALVKTKDEQILDLRRKLDQVQLEVESYRQKCVELNKVIDTNQESFKRTTRALRLAMANLELQEENKPALKKVD